jgi:LysM repeat protein
VAVPLHLAQESPGREKGGRQVLAQCRLPALERKLPHRDVLPGPDAGDRRAGVEAAEAVPGLGEEALGVLLAGQVGLEGEDALELAGEGLGSLPAAVVVNDETAALRRERTRAGSADTARGPRDEDTSFGQARFHQVKASATARPAIASTTPATATKAQMLAEASLSSSQRVRGLRTRGSVPRTCFQFGADVHQNQTMAAIEPGFRRDERVDSLLRQSTRLAVVAVYFTAAAVALVLVSPAFRDTGAAVVTPPPAAAQKTDVIRKGESVATFAARHGLDLGELLALNPKIDSLTLPSGTKLRIG